MIVTPKDLALRRRKQRRTGMPLNVSIASSTRFLGQPGPWLTSIAFPAAQTGQPSSSAGEEWPHWRHLNIRSGQSSSLPHNVACWSPDWIRNRMAGPAGDSGAAIPGRRLRWRVARSPRRRRRICARSAPRRHNPRGRRAVHRRGRHSAPGRPASRPTAAPPRCWSMPARGLASPLAVGIRRTCATFAPGTFISIR